MLRIITLGASLGFGSVAAHAQTFPNILADSQSSAYLQDARGAIVRSANGLCWRTGYWTPASAVLGCDGELAPPVTKATAPAVVAPPLAQTPAPMPTAPAVPKRCDFTVALQSDQTFAFNNAVLNDSAKYRIDTDVLPRLAACKKIDFIMVTGHTDQIGSHPYNQKLSEKRAEAVATYLNSKGVAIKIETLGAGKTLAVQSCDDKLPRAQLIECLAPNRRVVVEARGLAK